MVWLSLLHPEVAAPEKYEVSEAYDVYAAVLPFDWISRVAHARTLLIRETTESRPMCIHPDASTAKLLMPAITDYERLTKHPLQLQRQFIINKAYELVSADTLMSEEWDTFYERHPQSGGWVELSPVGFNKTKTIAVVYVGHHCGLSCGGGTFYILQKKGQRWERLRPMGASICAWAT
jgi:hypothetical protein